MKKSYLLIPPFLLSFCFALAGQGAFPIVTHTEKAVILYDRTGPKLDSITAHLLAEDIERVTSFKPSVITDLTQAKGNVIVVGEAQSALLRQLTGQSAIFNKLEGKWESFATSVIERPTGAISKVLVIAGSDTRGTAYGVFTLSEKIGVSPWYWWADVPVKQQEELVIDQPDLVSPEPSVRYRGIFINDEDFGLRPFAKGYEPDVKNIGPATYAKVFELLLRLKANFIWPAMHPGTAAFFSIPGNKEMAALYAIIIGSSHAEPMLRNNVGEWNEKTMGKFNWLINKAKIEQYWEDRVKESADINAVYTMGMRGIHDGQMEGVHTSDEAVPLLEQIFSEQRDLLQKYNHKDIRAIPQAFTPYKEVLAFYDNGLKVPDDITLVWPDDNYGYIERLSNDQEKARSGGAGVYYHVSYWGRPHDYLWLSSEHPSLIREEMMKAYTTGADRIWVLNVGDIKPAEYDIQLFLDMAYHIEPFKESSYSKAHFLHWNTQVFGKDAGAISDILWNYYELAFERRPEFMGWSQTEPVTPTHYTDYKHFFYGDEAQRRLDKYDTLEAQTEALRRQVDASHSAAFFELVYYPVIGAAEMNKKFLYRDKAFLYAKQNRISAYDYALRSVDAYHRIQKETEYYNQSLLNGKWKGMMSMHPNDRPVFLAPVLPLIQIENGERWGVAIEGADTANESKTVLPEFTEGLKQTFFVDVFLCDSTSVNWTAVASAGWITLSGSGGTLSPAQGSNQKRIWVTVDWKKAPPKDKSLNGMVTISGPGKAYRLNVPAFRPAQKDVQSFNGCIESNGYVSIYAHNYTKLDNSSAYGWHGVDGLGYTGYAMMTDVSSLPGKPLDTMVTKSHKASLSYEFITFKDAAQPAMMLFALPTLPVNKDYSVRCAFSIDNGPLQVVDFTADCVARTEEWKQNVLSNTASRRVPLDRLTAGKHTLQIFAIDPGVALDRMIIDLGGFKPAYSIVPETRLGGGL